MTHIASSPSILALGVLNVSPLEHFLSLKKLIMAVWSPLKGGLH